MDEYLQPLVEALEALQNSEKAVWAKNYMRNQFEYLGVDAPARKLAVSEFLRQQGKPEPKSYGSLACFMWAKEEREFQYAALDMLMKYKKNLQNGDIQWIEKILTGKPWWDTVDGLTVHLVGTYFMKFPDQIKTNTDRWMNSGNFWLQRACLLFQLKYKEQTDLILLSGFIEKLQDEKEFFIRKAIGWALREYSKTNSVWVANFIQDHNLSGLSTREASKYL